MNIVSSDADKVGLDTMLTVKASGADALPTELHGLAASLERLLAMIESTKRYVDDVVVRRVADSFAVMREHVPVSLRVHACLCNTVHSSSVCVPLPVCNFGHRVVG